MNHTTRGAGTPPSPVGIAPVGHRLPADTRLGPVHLQVADLARSLDWYGRVLGLRAHQREEGFARLAPSSSDEVLVELRERPGAAPVAREGRLGLFHVALLLPDRAALGAFLRHVATLGEPVGAADHLVSEALYLQDPDGLGVEVYADRPRSAWQVDGRELRMGTVALDAQDLASVASANAWIGAPAGTTVGHVHLHVGSLDRAEAFYHRGLGLDRTVWSYPGALFLAAGGYHHHLGLNTWSKGTAAGEDHAKLLDWQIVVSTQDAVDAAARGLREAGFEVDVAGGEARAPDPWGTTLRVVHRPAHAD